MVIDSPSLGNNHVELHHPTPISSRDHQRVTCLERRVGLKFIYFCKSSSHSDNYEFWWVFWSSLKDKRAWHLGGVDDVIQKTLTFTTVARLVT